MNTLRDRELLECTKLSNLCERCGALFVRECEELKPLFSRASTQLKEVISDRDLKPRESTSLETGEAPLRTRELKAPCREDEERSKDHQTKQRGEQVQARQQRKAR